MNNEKQLTNFQQELREAIHEYGNDICNEYWHGCDITPKLESFISRAVDIEHVNKLHYMWMESWGLAVQGLEQEDFAKKLIDDIHTLGKQLKLRHYE